MKLHTAEQLSDYLAEDLIWRKKELTALRKLVSSAKSRTDQQDVLIRSGVAMLYAHWEGFVKEAASAYLEFVAMQKLPYEKLTANFIALAMKRDLEQAKETNKASIFNQIVEFFLTGLSHRGQIPYANVIRTQSNLSSERMKEIVSTLYLDYTPYFDKKEIIDTKLVERRNNIAHGRNLVIGLEEYLNLQDEIIFLMNTFKNQIDNAAVMKVYLR